MLNVALPKGRLGDKVYRLFKVAATTVPPWSRMTAGWC